MNILLPYKERTALVKQGRKQCCACFDIFPLECFYKNTRGYCVSKCKKCYDKYNKARLKNTTYTTQQVKVASDRLTAKDGGNYMMDDDLDIGTFINGYVRG